MNIQELADSQGKKDFELIIGEGKKKEINNASVPVRWCIDSQFLKRMDETGIVKPHVVIAAFDKWGQEHVREMVPLAEMKVYLAFHKPGNYDICAWIFNGEMGIPKLKKRMIAKSDGSYRTDLIHDGTIFAKIAFDEDEDDIATCAFTYSNEYIPENAFAKEPAPWLKWYANYWYDEKPRDACDFRKRVGLAFAFKWFPMALFALFKMVAALLLGAFGILLGFYKLVHWDRIIHPFEYKFTEMGADQGVDEYRYFWGDGNVPPWKKYWPMLVTPINLIALTLLALMMMNDAMFPSVPFIIFAIEFSIIASVSFMSYLEQFGRTSNSWIPEFVMVAYEYCMAKFDKYVFWMEEYEYNESISKILLIIMTIISGFLLYMLYLFAMAGYATVVLTFVGLCIVSVALTYLVMWRATDDYMSVQDLLCPHDHENRQLNPDSVPIQNRTFRLWFSDLKQKVCKPMSW